MEEIKKFADSIKSKIPLPMVSDDESESSQEFLSTKLEETKKFAEFLDQRQDEINKRRKELDNREMQLLKREQELETEALKRQNEQIEELRRNSQELHAQELKKLSDEIAALRQKQTDELNSELTARRSELFEVEKNLADKKSELEDERKNHAENLWRELAEIRSAELKKLSDEIAALRQKQIDELNNELTARRSDLIEVEKNLADKKSELENERKNQTENLWRELAEIRAAELKKLNDEIADLRQKQTDELNKQLTAQKESADKQRAVVEQEFLRRQEMLTAAEEKLAYDKADFEHAQKNLDFDKMRLKKFEDTLKNRQVAIDSEVQTKLDDRYKDILSQLDAAKLQEKNLADLLHERELELGKFQNFKAVYGDTPELLQQKMSDLRDRNNALVDELGKRPGVELQDDYTRLENECARLHQAYVDMSRQTGVLQEQITEIQTLRNENTILKAAKENLKGLWDDAQETIVGLQTRIDRLTAAEITPADWDKRAASLREPYLTNPFNSPPLSAQDVADVDEISWLNRVENLFNDYGITFPRRILYAFHTSFKIANWSTLTVLAGVSGTGKSELPRLYSAFGGFNFITVPVQPNWDSQESMLGFFNSIDNKFDAQPVLRFLVECTEKYDNNMAVVLLDEMNLAHVEHYFADFLSKLETRRSSPENSVPEIFVNLGAGVKPYGLPLKRNILWCGTMNQDETTKSLSDKVLDRGIVINFPRPRKLQSRKGARPLETFCGNKGITPMNIKLWDSWREKSIKFKGDQLKQLENYRRLLESMNDHLSHAGRAIGHRVWQSIEHYVINYPTVRAAVKDAGADLTNELSAALHIAVEDQIVQKVMPKLRGIETRGKSYENCLVPIRGLLNDNGFNLNDDFDRACDMGYGQFMWSSAEYIVNEADPESDDDK